MDTLGTKQQNFPRSAQLTVLVLRYKLFMNLIAVFVDFQYKVGRLLDCNGINARHRNVPVRGGQNFRWGWFRRRLRFYVCKHFHYIMCSLWWEEQKKGIWKIYCTTRDRHIKTHQRVSHSYFPSRQKHFNMTINNLFSTMSDYSCDWYERATTCVDEMCGGGGYEHGMPNSFTYSHTHARQDEAEYEVPGIMNEEWNEWEMKRRMDGWMI